MRKILSFLFTVIFLCFMFSSVYASSSWVSLDLNYDGKLHKYNAEEIHIILEGTKVEGDMKPIILDGRTLVPLRSVSENMGAEVIWNNDEKEVTIIKEENEIKFKIGNSYGIKNSIEKFDFDVASKIINGYTMVPLRAISNAFDYDVNWDSGTRIVSINKKNEENLQSTTESITEETSKSQEINTEKFVAKENGIKIVWDQIDNVKANDLAKKRIPIDGLDVISPTWFAIKNSEGDILDKGSVEYSKWAKEQGYSIWALVTNSFNPKITHDTLSDKNKRAKIISQLLNYADKYKLDGINIDFENVNKKDGEYYLEFIKEATKAFKEKGLIVSVDMYVPTPWTVHYKMEEVAKIVDYIMIMAYDEHYSTSKESGSVASMPWVEKYIKEASRLVPKDKLIMGIPFYTRIWTEAQDENGNITVVSRSLTMEDAKKILDENNANIIFDSKTGQYYGEYISEGTIKKIWLEDEKSIEERMKISRKYDVKGIAAWKRGHEKEGIWDIINKYYK